MGFQSSFFVTHATEVQLVIYAALLLSLWLAEGLVSNLSFHKKWKHSFTNMLFILTALPVQLFMTIFLLLVSAWVVQNNWGLLNILPYHGSFFVKYFVGFLMLDFCEYLYHVIMHKAKPLWKFHLVHHTDLQLDVSTTVREHPVETFCRMCFLILWVFLSGASFGLLLLRQTFQTITNITSHTQFRLHGTSEKLIGWIFITPNMHHVHHHYQLPYTDRNYGDVLSIWDRLFGTFSRMEKHETIFGLDTHMDKEVSQSFKGALKIPFAKKQG
jgi:sterol desaturase/sphingolipid hydroxylase (fatty acid hydroxylase superfamily)